MNETLAVLQEANSLAHTILLIVIVYGGLNLVSVFIGHYLEARRLKLLINAKPEVLAVESLMLIKELVEKYGLIKSDSSPNRLVLQRSLSRYELQKVLLLFLLLALALYYILLML